MHCLTCHMIVVIFLQAGQPEGLQHTHICQPLRSWAGKEDEEEGKRCSGACAWQRSESLLGCLLVGCWDLIFDFYSFFIILGLNISLLAGVQKSAQFKSESSATLAGGRQLLPAS